MERNSINRLQFRHNPKVFSSSTEAIEAFYGWTTNGSDSLSLLAEPTVLLYHRDGDVYDQNPHVILAIGSHTNTSEGTWDERDNRYCFINIDEVRYKIKEHHDELKKEVSELTINEKDTATLALHAEKTENGTILSGDVKTPHIHAYSLPNGGYKTVENNIYVEDGIGTDNQPGLFVYVDLNYNDQDKSLVFSVSKDDGSIESKEVVKIKDTHVVAGEYKTDDESIHLELSDDSEVVIDCRYLLNEWTVDGGTRTPVILKKEEVEDGDYSHVNPYQDIISADIRLKDETMGDDGHWHRMEGSTNILNRTFDERALYVDGVASNIVYYTNGIKSNVQDKLDELSKLKISNDSNNIITDKIDGFFASSKLEYVSSTNTLVFKVSGRNDSGQTIEKKTEIKLNTVEFFKNVWYDSLKEELVIEWVDDDGKTQYTRIPIGQMIEEWEPQNEGHSVRLVRTRNVSGKDKVSADVKITATQPNNILQDINHELYVNGIASNIKYDITGTTNVKQKIDELREDLTTETNERKADVQFLSGSIDSVSAITDANIERIDNTIGTAFTADPHDNITYKFEQEVGRATARENEIEGNLNDEIARAESEEARIEQKLDDEIARATDNENAISGKLDTEIARSSNEDTKIENTIGTGFTDDPHTNITAKFEELTNDLADEVQRATDNENVISGKLDTEIARSSDKDNEHDTEIADINTRIGDGFSVTSTVRDEIDALSANTLSSIKNITSNNSSLTVVKSIGDDPTVDLEVNIYPKSGNTIAHIINGDDKGLFNFVELTYDAEHNELTFKKSLSDGSISVLPIQLQSISFIDEIYYDEATEELVIIYYSGHERKEERIPLRGLIDEWDVYNDVHSAVKLKKEWNSGLTKNILSAEVIVSDNADNILENIEGTLFVSNSGITANTAAIEAEVQRATARENDIEENLNNEITRAQGAEANLQTAIDNEANRAQSAETVLDAKIEAEELRASDAEMVLEEKIGTGFTTAETQTVTFKFNTLSGKLDTEVQNRIDDVDAEETRAIGVENAISGKLDTEIQNRIDDVDAEETRAKAAELELTNKIGTGFTTADTNNITAKFNALSGVVSQEISDRIADVNAEETRAQNAEAALQTAITTEVTRATSAETALQTAINSAATYAETALNTAITAEESRATSAETSLDNKIEAEETRATNAESALQTAINNETSAREIADTNLQGSINSEATRAQGVENTINSNLSNEIATRASKDEELNNAITEETANRISADNSLQAAITAETTRAQSAETALQTAITTETTRAEGAESILSGNINSLQSSINAEQQRAEAAEDSLQDAIDNITLEFSGSNTINFTKTAASTGSNITADVKVPTSDNIIIVDEGIKANVNLTYDGGTNTLTFVKSSATGDVTSNIQLNAGSIINGIEYNEPTKELIIKFETTQSTTEQEVRVEVSDLFNEWSPVTNHLGAVLLTKTSVGTGTTKHDELSAEVVISSQGSNILQNVGGALLVDGSGIISISAAVESLDTDLQSEIARSTSKDEELSTLIATETANRISGENSLQTAITAEATRAQSAETALDTAISNETTRATNAESNLQTAINNEISRSTSKDEELSTLIATETSNRTSADSALQTAINNEISRATSAETALNAAITVEATRAQNAEASLNTAITTEVTRATNAESALQTAISNETTRATNAETTLNNTISNETTRATNAESALQTAIDNEVQRAQNAESTLSGAILTISGSVGSLGTLTINTISGGSTTLAGTYNPSADSVIDITVPEVSMEALTFGIGVPSSGTYDGSVATSINIPNNITHLTDWDSATNTLNIDGNISVTGNATVSGTITAQGAIYSSDINLKENIAEAEYLKRVLANKIKVKEFNFKDDPNKAKVYGIIAQDLEANGLGEIVYTKDDGFKAVDYTSLMMLKIAYLENENKILRREFVDMNNKLNELMKKLDNND